MPILINSANFTDVFGNSEGFYRSNTVDQQEVIFNVSTLIRMSSVGNPLTLDPTLNQVLSPSVSWIEEGFRVGDPVVVRVHSVGGGLINSFNSNIDYVDDVMCDFGAMPDWYDITQGEFVVIIALDPANPSNVKARSDLDILFNHVKNSNPGSEFSLIDAEVTRLIMNGVESLLVGNTINAQAVGQQSGQFVVSAEITRNAQLADLFFNYDIKVVFMNSGMYDQSDFFSSEALKVFAKFEWSAVSGEPFERKIEQYTFNGNTGYFNEPHNSSLANSTINQTIPEVDYCVPTTDNIIVEGPLAELGIGCAYKSINDAYFKNKLLPQQRLTMAIPTTPLAVGVTNSFLSESGAGYTLEINSINSVGLVHTINLTFTPNILFNNFMSDVEDGDRLFFIWVKCGNINWLAFESQLQCDPPVGGPLIMTDDYGFLDHSQNINEITGVKTGFEANTEDDLAYFGTFTLEKEEIVESLSVKIEAFNSSTNEDFTLLETSFGFGSVQISGDGRYLLDESLTVVSTLPSNSLKRDAELKLHPAIDSGNDYGVSIYFPFLLNWQYWLQQSNASVDFYPTQNKDWQQYDDLPDWDLRIEISVIKDGLAFTHSNVIIDKDYDSDPNVEQNIELFIDSTNQNVDVAIIGGLMRVVATHTLQSGSWDQVGVWGMITVETYESVPRKICSSVLPFDNDFSNSLTPLDGVLMIITFPLSNLARMECFFDPDVIDLTNGCKFTTKIKQICPILEEKTMTDGTTKTTTTGDIKTLTQ